MDAEGAATAVAVAVAVVGACWPLVPKMLERALRAAVAADCSRACLVATKDSATEGSWVDSRTILPPRKRTGGPLGPATCCTVAAAAAAATAGADEKDDEEEEEEDEE